jgi:Na+-transporting NADH:ubiquinone oxidoreductase subunit E
MEPDPALTAWTVFLAAVLTDNILLSNFLGMCSFLGLSRDRGTSLGMGAAVTFVIACTTVLNHQLYHRLLVPLELTHLTFIVFILVIAAFVQLVEIVLERISPALHYAMGIFLPLITVNCAILGTSLFMVIREYSLAQSAGYGLGAGLGWVLAIWAMAGVRRRLRFADVPAPLQGLGITMIVTALMAMAFMGFAGVVRAR